jgi:hypothetical protein
VNRRLATVAGLVFFLLWLFSGKELSGYLLLNLFNLPLVLGWWIFSLVEREQWLLWLWFRILFMRNDKKKSKTVRK